MRAFIPSETALVLGGGGAKGAYEVGAIAALDALGVKAGSVFGTSVGALNGSLIVMGDLEKARRCTRRAAWTRRPNCGAASA